MLHDGMHSALNTVCEKNFKHFKKLYALKIATPEKNVFVFFLFLLSFKSCRKYIQRAFKAV